MGNLLTATDSDLANYNPLRYRGYVYDWETKLYYLQSRNYNPEWGRFINADVYISTGQGFIGCNTFAYCINNPVRYRDMDGKFADDYYGLSGGAIGAFLYELFTGNTHPSRQTQQLEAQIIVEQNKIIGDATEFAWDVYMRWNQIQQEAQYQNSCALIEGVEYFYNNPKKAETTVRDMVTVSSSASVLITTAIAGGPATAIWVATGAFIIAMWDLGWMITDIVDDFE